MPSLTVDGLSGFSMEPRLSRPLEPPRSGLFLRPVKRSTGISCLVVLLCVSLVYFRLLLSAEDLVFPVFCCVPSFVDELFRDDLDSLVFYFTCVLWTFRNNRFLPETLTS
ncbi:hypothetical protein NPIL_554021 [Nephila pilipes]|uniref:Uncharacterized protein n=1 Tax=Nephila pilipes TaxID=299642 RepID=A0A8X6PEK2_NEPPI|nr:hypothetical protein NPIL_554021 [Nephila pilipes]